MVWLPEGWWTIIKGGRDIWTWEAGAKNLPDTSDWDRSLLGVRISLTERQAHRDAKKALRLTAYRHRKPCWTKFRVHTGLEGCERAFCGAKVEHTHLVVRKGGLVCARCSKILDGLQELEEVCSKRTQETLERLTEDKKGR